MKVLSILFFLFVITCSSFSQNIDKMSKKELKHELYLLKDSVVILKSRIDDFQFRYNALDSKYLKCIEESKSLSLRFDELEIVTSQKDSEILKLGSALKNCKLELDSLELSRAELSAILIGKNDSIIYLTHALDSFAFIESQIIDTMLFVGSEFGDRGVYITFQSSKYKLMNQNDSLITFDSYNILSSAYESNKFEELVIAAETESTEAFIGRAFIVEIVLDKKEIWYGGEDWGYWIKIISPSLKSVVPLE